MPKRKTDRHLPPCVYHKHGAYWLVKNGKWTRLADSLSAALAEYGRRMESPKGSMGELIERAFDAMKHRLSPATVDAYTIAAKKLKDILLEFTPDQVRPKHMADIKNSFAATPNMGNRVVSFARLVFDYALEQQMVEMNPAVGIKRHKERKRDRLVSLEDFNAIRAKADARLQIIMDLLYLTGQRVDDVLRIKRADLKEDGILFVQQKTKARLVVRWTPELRDAVARAGDLCGNVRAFTLLHNRRGRAPDYKTTWDQWRDACAAAGIEDTTLRDIRAMSLTAAKREGKDPTALAGHATQEMTVRYLRDREIPVVDGPSFRHLIDSAA